MSITSTQKKETNVVEMEIAVSAQELKEAADKVYKRKAKSINVPGFRKGKAPRSVIERMYGQGVFLEDAVNDLYPKAYGEAIKEADIEPVDRADIEILSMDMEAGLTFKATVTVKPEVTIGEYKGIAVNKTAYKVKDSEVDDELERRRQRAGRVTSVEGRPAKDGDTTTIDFEGFMDGTPFEGGKGQGHKLELGSRSFIEGFEEQIVGHSIGDEFEVTVTFPEQYHAEDLAGKPAVFKVKLHEISEKQLPELDDEFAKDISEFDTLNELRGDIRDKLAQNKERKAVDEMESDIVGIISDKVSGEIPEVMYEQKIDEALREFAIRLQSQGMNLETYLQYMGQEMQDFRESFREQAQRHVKMRLALETIAAKESLTATDEEVEEEYKKLAERYRVALAQAKTGVDIKDVRMDIACHKAVDLVKQNAVITEVEEEAEKPEEAPEEKPAKKPAKSTAKKVAATKSEKADTEEKPAPKKRAPRKTTAKPKTEEDE